MSELFLRSRWFEDLPVGEFHVFGSHTFSELEMIEFSKIYAPRPEYTDPVAARGLRHGGLVAAPWHVVAMWMQMMVAYMERYAHGVQDGRRNGAGVSVENIEWLEQVRPGHTIAYTYEIIKKPEKIVRDRWGIIRSRNEAFNHYGDKVMSFEIDILAERAPS